MNYYLAIDIGASSGRHILGYIENNKLKLEEIYRFDNGIKNIDSTLAWDSENLFNEVKNGLKKCKENGIIPTTIAIDTWGVDYVLLDKNKKEIFPAVSYRDSRTIGINDEVAKIIPNDELFNLTGIQPYEYNSIYQLYCDKKSGKLDNAEYFLMTPEYLSFKLTGIIKNEYTLSTTGGLVNAKTFERDESILNRLGIKKSIFAPLSMPSTLVGEFSKEIESELGFNSKVVLCASHDTASAVAACSVGDNGFYISSGTWSLIGAELEEPVTSKIAFDGGFTNEGGINHRFRFLKNIMGMWLLQNIRKNLNKKYTYDEMMEMAMQSTYTNTIDTNDNDFLAPENMIDAIRNKLNEPNLPIADVINCVYHSLAKSYSEAVKVVENATNKQIDVINIVGGGCKDKYLNELTHKYTGKKVLAGPVEATATGNIIAQMMYLDNNLTLNDARQLVKNSFDIKES